jgi:hypothetical protein
MLNNKTKKIYNLKKTPGKTHANPLNPQTKSWDWDNPVYKENKKNNESKSPTHPMLRDKIEKIIILKNDPKKTKATWAKISNQ